MRQTIGEHKANIVVGSPEAPPYDTIALKQVNANTFTDVRKKTGGPYQATGRTVVSKDGKTMTATAKGTNGQGKAFTSAFVFDKQ